jgi:hypothetical protein
MKVTACYLHADVSVKILLINRVKFFNWCVFRKIVEFERITWQNKIRKHTKPRGLSPRANIPSDCRMSAKLVPTVEDRGCHVVNVTDHYGRILSFIDRSRYFAFQVAPQLYSRGWADPVPDTLLLRKSDSAGNRTRTSGSVARNSDH